MKKSYKIVFLILLLGIFLFTGNALARDNKIVAEKNKVKQKTVVKANLSFKSTEIDKKPVQKKVEKISKKNEVYPFDKSIELSDLIVKVEITKKNGESNKPEPKTSFGLKVLETYKTSDKIKDGSMINVNQDGSSNYIVNDQSLFKVGDKMILFLKKASDSEIAYNILSGNINIYRIIKGPEKEYIPMYDNVDRMISWFDEMITLNDKSKEKKFLVDLSQKAVSSNKSLQIYSLNSFTNKLKEIIKEKNSLFLTKYDVNQIDNKIVDSSNEFGIDILKKELESNNNENVFISPFSLFTAFSILSNGASSKTQEEIRTVLGINNYSSDNLNVQLNNLLNYLNNGKRYGEPGVIKIYNSLWIDNNFNVNKSFINDANKYYDTDVFKQKLASKTTLNDMNQWILDKSGGLIKNPIQKIDNTEVFRIFNVLHFIGKWVNPFKTANTKKEAFTLSSGESINVDMMNDLRTLGYYEDDETKACSFDYYNGSMMILLPKGDINKFVKGLNKATIDKFSNEAKMYKVKVKLPKLNIEYNNDIVKSLKALGMELPFDSSKADFSNLKTDNSPLSISKVQHNCVLRLDEEGTEAAALTSVLLCGAAKPPEEIKEFYVTKPFIFIIRGYGNVNLFIGKVESPINK